MGFLSCNADFAVSVCDPFNFDSASSKTTKPIKIRHFTYHELATAASCFSADAFLGKGSHGTVYKATLDHGKLTAAVKKTTSHQTATADNEIEILSHIHHPRLVNLIGFCARHSTPRTQLLVVEYMPNGSLHELLHASPRPPGWTRRVRFGLQVAKAVHALHSSNPPIIHRDIKSSNVLLDGEWKARLSDFGLALRGHVEDVRVKCTPPAGTMGYLDPGYLAPGDLSTKSDVFSYGILLLEIISGRNAIDVHFSPTSIVDWAVPLIKRGDYAAICDRRLGQPPDPVVIRNLAIVAARCVRSTAAKRPGMAEVVEILKSVNKRIHAPPLWNELRKRMGRVRRSEVLDGEKEWEGEGIEEGGGVKAVKVAGGNRKSRKISSVSSSEYGSETSRLVVGSGVVGDRVIRSRSIGSYGERGRVSVKMVPVVKLSKSRSTGLLQNPRRLVFEFGSRRGNNNVDDANFRKLYSGPLDEKKIQEKPLVVPI